jgi:NADH:ubiquinone oxidoreductase subunit 4 (subunit M)
VEASVVGSMILAAVLLKLGGYGLIRLNLKVSQTIKNTILLWAMITSVIVGLVAFRVNDIKMLIAYSSILHMGLVVLLFTIPKKTAVFFGIVLMVSHGFIRRGMFQSFKNLYIQSKSRKMLIKKGVNNIMPLFMCMFFFFCCMKRSVPLSLRFISEINFSFLLRGLKIRLL